MELRWALRSMRMIQTGCDREQMAPGGLGDIGHQGLAIRTGELVDQRGKQPSRGQGREECSAAARVVALLLETLTVGRPSPLVNQS